MSVRYSRGFILDAKVDAIVAPCNSLGDILGGITQKIQIKHSIAYAEFSFFCRNKLLTAGKTVACTTGKGVPKYVLYTSTKERWNKLARPQDIMLSIESIKEMVDYRKINTLAIPLFDCEFANKNSKIVEAKVRELFQESEVDVWLFKK